MDDKKKDKMITIFVVALVGILMALMVVMLTMYTGGSIDEQAMLMMSTALSSAMFVVVIVYGAYSLKIQNSAKSDYERFLEEKENEEKKGE